MTYPPTQGVLDVAGVGIGPFNMSTAALMATKPELSYRFFDRRESFSWHPGLLFPEATIQVHFLRDLVSLADPTNPFSFASFLKAKKRMYRFLNADFPRVMRPEFNQYFQWASKSIPGLEFGTEVKAAELVDDHFEVDLGGRRVAARNLVLGTGLARNIPECARPYLGAEVYHAIEFLHRDVDFRGKRVALVGGGQTGAELVTQLLADENALPAHLTWISRRPNFQPLDLSPFVSDIFAPAHSEHFFNLPREDQKRLLGEQKLASDGIDYHLLEQIYRRLYVLEFLSGVGRRWTLRPGFELQGVAKPGDHVTLTAKCQLTGALEDFDADVVILCTGFQYALPSCLGPLRHRLHLEDEQLVVRPDFSVEWDGPEDLKIYVQNATRHCRGVADPNLSLMAWRSCKIINSILGQDVYDVEDPHTVIDWPGLRLERPAPQPV